MSDTQQQPSAGDIARIRSKSASVIEIRHSDAAEKWALSEERTPVLTITRPNPDFVPADQRPALELADGEVAPPYEVPELLAVEYTMPSTPNPGLALKYLRMARENAELAMSWLIELALGTEGYDAFADELAGYDDPTEAQIVLNSVVARIQRIAMGGLEGKA